MIRYLIIGVLSILLFFPAYWLLSKFLGDDWGAGAAMVMMYIGFPALMLKLWKSYPPMYAVPVEPGDPDMQRAIDRARREIGRFERGIRDAKKEAYVKYPVSVEDGGVEHVWGLAHSIEKGGVVVTLVNEPVGELVDAGQSSPRGRIPLTEIEDWMLVDTDGKCEGGYSHLALVQIYRRIHGKIPKSYLRDLEAFVDIHPSEYL